MGDFSYYYDIPFELDVMPEMVGAGAFGVFIIVYLLLMLFAGALSMVVYVLHSLSLYTIANRRGIRHGWLAWIPVCNLWILGSIADQYQYVAKGKVKNRRKLLLGLSIGLAIGYFLWLFATLFNLAAGNEGTALLLLILGGLAIAAVAIWLVVCQYLAYYDLYKSCEPGNAALYLVLSILFNITMPFFLFACRKKDGGMPPRKQPAQPVNAYPAEPVDTYPTEPVNDYPTEPIEEGFAQPEEFEDE